MLFVLKIKKCILFFIGHDCHALFSDVNTLFFLFINSEISQHAMLAIKTWNHSTTYSQGTVNVHFLSWRFFYLIIFTNFEIET